MQLRRPLSFFMDLIEQKKQAMITALRMLTASPKSSSDLAKKLRMKGYAEQVIEETLLLLEKQRILDDRAYALNVVQKYRFGQPSGRQRIKFELKRRGVSRQVCEEVVAGLNPEEEIQSAREAAQNRWEKNKSLPEDKRKKKIYDFLLRRGFDFQLVREVMGELTKNEIDD